jgi:hypothetical protein
MAWSGHIRVVAAYTPTRPAVMRVGTTTPAAAATDGVRRRAGRPDGDRASRRGRVGGRAGAATRSSSPRERHPTPAAAARLLQHTVCAAAPAADTRPGPACSGGPDTISGGGRASGASRAYSASPPPAMSNRHHDGLRRLGAEGHRLPRGRQQRLDRVVARTGIRRPARARAQFATRAREGRPFTR